MGLVTIENRCLFVSINTKGAELCSLIDKTDGIDHMWRADPQFWPRHAPILFPCVGESKEGKINIGGTDYHMGRHGFARHQEFELVEYGEDNVIFQLRNNTETEVHFPFDFLLKVTFRLEDNKLVQEFEVKNLGKTPLGFQLGGHPAFAVPFNHGEQYNEYQIRFDSKQKLHRHLLTKGGLYSGETRKLLDDEDSLGLSYELFEEDALVFKNIPSKQVGIQKKSGGKKLIMDFAEFPHFGIWSVPGANYVCLEPWIGCADMANQPGDFFSKDSLVELSPEKVFNASFSVTIVQ